MEILYKICQRRNGKQLGIPEGSVSLFPKLNMPCFPFKQLITAQHKIQNMMIEEEIFKLRQYIRY